MVLEGDEPPDRRCSQKGRCPYDILGCCSRLGHCYFSDVASVGLTRVANNEGPLEGEHHRVNLRDFDYVTRVAD